MAHQADVIVGAVDAGEADPVGAGRAGRAAAAGVAADQGVGGAVRAARHRRARIGVLGRPFRQLAAVVDEDPVRLPAGALAIQLADQLHRRAVARRHPGDGAGIAPPDRADRGLLGGVARGQAEPVTAFDRAVEDRAGGVALAHADQARTLAVVDRQPQHRLGPRLRPDRQAQRADDTIDLRLVETHHQLGLEGRRAVGGHALVLAVVVAGDVVLGAAQFLADAGAAGRAAIAADLGQHLRQGPGEAVVALGIGLAVDRDLGLVDAAGRGAIAFDPLRLGDRRRQRQGQTQPRHPTHSGRPLHRPSTRLPHFHVPTIVPGGNGATSRACPVLDTGAGRPMQNLHHDNAEAAPAADVIDLRRFFGDPGNP